MSRLSQLAGCVVTLLALVCPVLATDSPSGAAANQAEAWRVSVYPSVPLSDSSSEFAAGTPFFDLKVRASRPLDKTRPLLLIIDPGSYPKPELRRRAHEIADVIRIMQQPFGEILIGIPILDGVVAPPITDPNSLHQALDRVVTDYVPESAGRPGNLGYLLDLIATLLQKVQAERGAVDCLIVAKDRQFADQESEYLNAGMERRLLDVCLQQGSTVHGCLEGTGRIRPLCLTTGGEAFAPELLSDAIGKLAGARRTGFMLDIEKPKSLLRSGRFELTIRLRHASLDGLVFRAPGAVWINQDGRASPGYHQMRQALDWVRRALEAGDDGNLTLAQRFLENSLQDDSWNPEIYYLAASVAARAEDVARAAAYITRAVGFVSPSERALVLYGEVFRNLGRASAALETIDSVLARGRSATPALELERARLLSAAGRHREARPILESLLGSGSDDDRVRAEYGRVLWVLGDASGAGTQFQSALAGNPENLSALIGLSEIAVFRGTYPQALSWAQQAVRFHAKNPDAHVQVGKVRAAEGDWLSAAGSFEAALNLVPSRRDVLDLLADALVRAGRHRQASEVLFKALAGDPKSAGTYRKLAQVQTAGGKLSDAAGTLEWGASRVPEEGHILYREAARLRERALEFGQAFLDYRAMLRSAPQETARRLTDELSSHFRYLSLSLGSSALDPPHAQGNDRDQADVSSRQGVQQAAGKPSGPEKKISVTTIPGGLSLLARTIGIDESELNEADATERVFSYLVEIRLGAGQKLADTPIRRDVAASLRNYDALIQHMRKRGLLPTDFDPRAGREFVFPFAGSSDDLARTKRLLAFFGVDFKVKRNEKGDASVLLAAKQNQTSKDRQQLLRNLGTNLYQPRLREIRFRLHDGELPILYDENTWLGGILAREKTQGRTLFERLVRSARGMKLYVGLAGCSESTREGLLRSGIASELLDLAGALSIFGRYLDFREGSLFLPGAREAWEQLLGVRYSEPAKFIPMMLRRDQGRALLLYCALLTASKGVQDYFTGSPERLLRLYQLFAPYDSIRLLDSAAGFERQDLGRLLRLLDADEHGLILRIDQRFARHLLAGSTPAADVTQASASKPIRFDLNSLAALIGQAAGASANQPFSTAEFLEFLKYLQSAHPEPLTDRAITAIMNNSGSAPLFLDLVWDLEPSSDLLDRYLGYCVQLAAGGDKGWNINRTRTSQALFYLLSSLRRENVLDAEAGLELLAEALKRVTEEDEGNFAQAVAGFVSEKLLPALERSVGGAGDASQILSHALAGAGKPREFSFDGRLFRLDLPAYRMQRMKAAIQHQRYTPLENLLAIYRTLSDLSSGTGPALAHLQSLSAMLSDEKVGQWEPASVKGASRLVAHADLKPLRSRLEAALAAAARGSSDSSRLAREAAAALHPELGVTLLAYCYAYHGTPETDALAFDPNLVRKHAFYGAGGIARGEWTISRLDQQEKLGSFIVGSLSGLGYELARLETAQAVQSFGKEEGRGMVPTLVTGMRVIPRQLRSERAQEYVALSVRLGRELVALSSSNPSMNRWVEHFIATLLPPRRRELVAASIKRSDLQTAMKSLSPSELFFLGEAYMTARSIPEAPAEGPGSDAGVGTSDGDGSESVRAEMSSVPEIHSPAMDRLTEIMTVTKNGREAGFREEVEQYGVLLRRRLGLRRLSFFLREPYEELESRNREETLYERICDLKIRLAEINYALGIPAFLAEVEGELALRDILPRSAPVRTSSWKMALEQISRLGTANARRWIEELLSRDTLTLPAESEVEK